MIKGRDFIFTSLQRWDITIGSNAHDIAKEIAKNNRVLFINSPEKDVKDYPAIQTISDNLFVLNFPFTLLPLNRLPDGWLFDLVNKFNQRRMAKLINSSVKKLGFKDPILFIDNDVYRSFYAPDFIKHSISIYYRRDNLVSEYWASHTPRLEPLLVAKCDCVASNSPQLRDAVSAYNNQSEYVGQGVDLSAYDLSLNYSVPKDIQLISRPIIGYTGWITTLRLDVDLMYKIAHERQDISMVLVGPEDEVFAKHPIHTLENVYFLGNKNPEDIPMYIAAFDICFNPQLINPITIGNYPRKIDEYLALGKPTIATKTKTMSIFEEHVWNCETLADYLLAIDKALEPQDKAIIQERITFAHSHSWTNSVAKIYEMINNCKKKT